MKKKYTHKNNNSSFKLLFQPAFFKNLLLGGTTVLITILTVTNLGMQNLVSYKAVQELNFKNYPQTSLSLYSKENNQVKTLDQLNKSEVIELQKLLKFSVAPNLVIDGVMGSNTRSAFYKFKQSNFLNNPNQIGPSTWKTLKQNNYQYSNAKFLRPTNGIITSGYGNRSCVGCSRFHRGIDFAVPIGTNVVASNSGIVIFAGWNGGYGNQVQIKHQDGKTSSYSHLSRIKVRQGQIIYRGVKIAESGNTGQSTGPHLHFEIKDKNGTNLNPANFL